MQIKRLFYIFLLFSFSGHISAQNKSERRIYLWDVTLSTKGFGGTPNIYNDVVEFLEKEINSITDESTEIVVLPFQERILETWKENATISGKNNIINKIKSYKNNNVTSTNIVTPIKEVQRSIVVGNRRNLLFLLTDGKQTGGNAELLRLIQNWDRFAESRDVYAVYIMLTNGAIDQQVIKIIEGKNKIFAVMKGKGKINCIDLRPSENIKFNIKDDMGKSANLPLSCNKNITWPDGISIKVTSANNPYVTIDQTTIVKNQKITFNVEYKKSYQTLKDSLPQEKDIPLHLELVNKNQIRKNTGLIVLLNPVDLHLTLINKPEKTLRIHVIKKHEN